MENICKLSTEEFEATFIAPMTFMDIERETSGINLKLFVESVIEAEGFKITISEMSIDSIYHNGNKTYEHILINYGMENIFLVIVIRLEHKIIYGYHILDLNEKYDLNN